MIAVFILILIIIICIMIMQGFKRMFVTLPKFAKYIILVTTLILGAPIMILFIQEMVIPCDSESWLMSLEKRVDRDLEKNNPKKTIVINNIKKIYVIHKDTIKITEKEFVHNLEDNYEYQMNQLRNWKILSVLPKNINKEEYINYLSRCQYPFYLALIHYAESSFDTNADNGSYVGLGQHDSNFIKECGYSMHEYKKSWKLQLYVSLEYIKKYVDRIITEPEELYAYWLKSGWNGENNIYCKQSRLPNGRKPYYPNRNLDKYGNNNGCIEVNPDLSKKFKILRTKV